MSIIRGLGKFAGKTAGFVVGKPIEAFGKVSGIDLIEDIGKGVQQASEFAGDTVGQVAYGAVNTVTGIIKEDPSQRDKGLGDMGNAVSRTAKGVVETVKHTIHNGSDVVGGVIDGDNDRIKRGAASLVKTVAIGALAVGVVDLVDGADGVVLADSPTDTPIDSDSTPLVDNDTNRLEGNINEDLAGSEHPETGVPFVEKTVTLPDGESVTGVFPIFESNFDVTIDESLYLQSDYVQFSYANVELYEAIQADPSLAEELGLTDTDIQALSNGDTPEGYTWHHNEQPGLLQLVNQEEHANTGHTGGRELWGGGSENR
ncbi:HNH endonuclease [Robertmurraya sp. FSL R5-0851]|uniref:HNH endonuclease n=1 Tax=Robertmurraya sp. FSL R5-0851 TaxID=2921584 RepID=UPI0030F55A64